MIKSLLMLGNKIVFKHQDLQMLEVVARGSETQLQVDENDIR